MNDRVRKSEIDQLAEMVSGLVVTMGDSAKEQTEILRSLSDSIRTQATGQFQHVTLPQPPPPPRSERLLWAMSVLVLLMVFVTAVSVVAALFQGQRVTDLRIDLQAERSRADTHAAWAREESQIIRSYIWQGKVPRLNPYPETQK